MNKLEDNKKSLIKHIKSIHRKYTMEMVESVLNLYDIGRKIIASYSAYNISEDTGIDPSIIFRFLSWGKSTTYLKNSVKKNLITLSVGLLITSNVDEGDIDYVSSNIIKNRLNSTQAYEYIRNGYKRNKGLKGVRARNPTKLWIDMGKYFNRVSMFLDEFEKVPVRKRSELLDLIEEIKEKSITVLNNFSEYHKDN